MLLLLTQMIFLERHEFFQLTWIGLFGTKWVFLHLENPDLQEIFLSKLTQFCQGTNMLDGPASNTYVFLSRDACVSSTQLSSPIRKKRAFSTFNILICRKYSFQKGTQLSHGNNVLDVAASNIHGVIWRGTWVSWTQLNSPTWNKHSLSPPGKIKVTRTIRFKNSLNSHRETMC
jgi:hypothetical protein